MRQLANEWRFSHRPSSTTCICTPTSCRWSATSCRSSEVRRDVEGALSVSRREDAVVPRQPREGLLPLLRLRRRRRRDQVHRAAREGQLHRGRADAGATRFGLAMPGGAGRGRRAARAAAEREALLKVHEVAAAWFRTQLLTPAATRVRQQLADRGMSAQTIAELGFGYAPPLARRAEGAPHVEGLRSCRSCFAAAWSCSETAERSSIGSAAG